MRKLDHVEIPRPTPEDLSTLPRHPIVVLLDNVRSLHNVGSIFRTSDAARVDKIILTGITATPEHRGLHKTALGSQDTVPWIYIKDPIEAARRLKAEGYTLAALEITDSPTTVESLEIDAFPLCLIIGNEVFGVSDELINLADLALEIPQYGAKQSLNASVAFGIAVFDVVRHYLSFPQGSNPSHHNQQENKTFNG